jgi:hypothetical protein
MSNMDGHMPAANGSLDAPAAARCHFKVTAGEMAAHAKIKREFAQVVSFVVPVVELHVRDPGSVNPSCTIHYNMHEL